MFAVGDNVYHLSFGGVGIVSVSLSLSRYVIDSSPFNTIRFSALVDSERVSERVSVRCMSLCIDADVDVIVVVRAGKVCVSLSVCVTMRATRIFINGAAIVVCKRVYLSASSITPKTSLK